MKIGFDFNDLCVFYYEKFRMIMIQVEMIWRGSQRVKRIWMFESYEKSVMYPQFF